ncbi:MAG: thiamine-phosphate kinase [Methanocorpusculum sp.]|nr:thiamine-phosphate kinase [Methanocorpusculum sp.]
MNETELLNQIKSLIGEDEISDDCASFEFPDGKILVSSTDMLHETTDFPKGMTDFEIGWMSTAVTLSDIASCGAKPIQILAAVGLDNPKRLYEIMRGACFCAEKYGAKVSGGDIDSHNELTIVTTGFGIVEKKNYLRRFGASVGDAVCITKIPGRAQAALDGYEKYREFLITPKPDVYEGQKIAESGASCMMDVSDGLALSLYYIAETNNVGIELDLSSAELPDVDSEKRLEYFLYGGGDFGLLFCKPQTSLSDLDIDFTVIGKIVEGSGVKLGSEKIEKRGYTHSFE